MAEINRTEIVLGQVAPVIKGSDPAEDVKALAERVDSVLTSLKDQMKNFEAADASEISGIPASSVISGAQAMYYQTFENDVTEDWDLVTGSILGVTYPSNGQAGGRAFRTTLKEVHLVDNTNIAFDPSRLYRIRARIRDVSGTHRPAYVGVACYEADGTTLIGYARICLSITNSNTTWTTYSGYFKNASGTTVYTSPSTDASAPRTLHQDTRYIRPYLHLSVGGDDQTCELDYITLEILTETSETNVILTEAGGRSVTTIAGTIKSDGVINTDKVAGDSIAAGSVGGGGDAGKNHIVAGSIQAVNIKAGTITANEVATNTLTAGNILTLTMTGKSCTFDTGSVGGWTMASGNLSAGSVTFDATNERLLLGSASAPLTGVGVFLGKDGSDYEFRAGDPSGEYLHWDGSNLTVKGTISGNNFTGTNALFGGQVTCQGDSGGLDTQMSAILKARSLKFQSYDDPPASTQPSSFEISLSDPDWHLTATAAESGDPKIKLSAASGVWSDDDLEIDGTLNHDGSSVGFFAATPVGQSTGWTITNDNLDKVLNCDSTSIDELADVLASVINGLINLGLFST